MPSKFKKAIAVVKDRTSISLAKVGGNDSSSLEVAILKATTHDEGPIDERHVVEVLEQVSSNKTYARSCARAIGRRIGRTKNWVVAVKSLMLVLRIFQDGDLHFPKEVLHAMKRGYKILNLTSFRDESSTSCPWDFTAFVRTFALYLDERLECFLTGKLQRRTSHQQSDKTRGYPRKSAPFVRDMKPALLLDRITHWQKLLDRGIASQPTGAAKTNKLVKICLYAIVQETFELYRDISDGLSSLIDGFFHLPYNNCVTAFQTCVKASKQFKELSAFHDMCKTIGVGIVSEYPTVQKISDELLETLKEFLKDKSSFPSTPPGDSAGNRDRSTPVLGGSQSMSLEELITADPGLSPDRYSDPGMENLPHGGDEDVFNENDTASVRSDPTDHRGINSVLDLLSIDAPSPPPELYQSGFEASLPREDGWELVLFETSNQPTEEPKNDNNSILPPENNYSNPFLEDIIDDLNSDADLFASFPLMAQPSFSAEGGFPDDLGLVLGEDQFSSGFTTTTGVDFASDFAADFAAPTSSNDNSHQSLPVDLFGEFSDNFGTTQNSATRDVTAKAMTEIVPFSQENNVDFFSSSATFQAAPTFRANSIDTDSGFGLENDPFGTLTAMTGVEQQQQLWLQNQNSILARHLT